MKSLTLLLIYPDFLEESKFNKNNLGNYSEGLASISAVVKEAGHNVLLYHQLYMPSKDEFFSKLKEYKPDIIGFTARTTGVPYIKEMCSWIEDERGKGNWQIPVIVGGYHAILAPDEVINIRGVDIVCLGEGEYPIRDIMNCIAEEKSYDEIESIYIKKTGGEIIKNPVAPLIEDLDELPFPDFELFEYEKLDKSRHFTALVMLSRGCLFSCTYCGNSQFRNIYPNKKKYCRFRSPEKAIELLELLIKRYPFIKYIEFRDAIFNMFKDWFYEFMPMYIEKIHLPFNCNLRFDVLDEEMVKMLADGGCYMIDIGLETGNEEFRTKYLHRSMKNEHLIQISKWFQKYNITSLTYNIVGLPYETINLSLETIKLNAKLDVDKVIPNIFYPYPMTILEKTAREGGFLDPTVDPNDPVQLRMKDYPKSDILYISYNFNKLVKEYKRIFALPENESKIAEQKLDSKILNAGTKKRERWYKSAKRKEDIMVKAKRSLKRLSPKLYIFLKNLTMRKRA